MKRIITGQDDRVGPWVAERVGGKWVSGLCPTIGLEQDGELVAGVMYADWNGANIMMHCAGIGKNWLNREFLWFAFWYPFEQLGCRRVTVSIASTNEDSLRFCRHLGFVHEATLTDAHPTGNLEIMAMRREQCRWLEKRK